MNLIYHPLSPFSRFAYIIYVERSLQHTHPLRLQKVVVCPVVSPPSFPAWSTNNDEVAQLNPIAKIPTLVLDDGTVLFDSRVIAEYFVHLADQQSNRANTKDARYWTDQAITAAAMQILDAGVLMTYEERLRKPISVWYQDWYDGQRQKMTRGLDFLDQAVKEERLTVKRADEPASVADAAVAMVVLSADVKINGWREGRENLAGYFDGMWKERKSFVETHPEKDWERQFGTANTAESNL